MSIPKLIRILCKPFISGIIAILPLTLTIVIVAWLAEFIGRLIGPDSAVGQALKQFGWSFGAGDTGAYLGGVLFAIGLIYLFGILVQIGLKGGWEKLVDAILMKLPLIKIIYDAAKKMLQMVDTQNGPDMKSMTPVLCQFGGENGTSLPAFLPTSETIEIQGCEYHVVMIPTAPVPFGGAIMCVPKANVTELDCGIDGLLNMYMSLGTTVPNYIPPGTANQPQDAARNQ